MNAAIEERYGDQRKETCALLAMFSSLGTGAYLFATTPHASFLSWQFVAFLFAGMFIIPIVLGIPGYLVTSIVRAAIIPGLRAAPILGLFGLLVDLAVMAAMVIAGIWIARWAFTHLT